MAACRARRHARQLAERGQELLQQARVGYEIDRPGRRHATTRCALSRESHNEARVRHEDDPAKSASGSCLHRTDPGSSWHIHACHHVTRRARWNDPDLRPAVELVADRGQYPHLPGKHPAEDDLKAVLDPDGGQQHRAASRPAGRGTSDADSRHLAQLDRPRLGEGEDGVGWRGDHPDLDVAALGRGQQERAGGQVRAAGQRPPAAVRLHGLNELAMPVPASSAVLKDIELDVSGWQGTRPRRASGWITVRRS